MELIVPCSARKTDKLKGDGIEGLNLKVKDYLISHRLTQTHTNNQIINIYPQITQIFAD